MNRRQLIGSIGFATAVQAAPAARNRFIGVWRLISCERKSKGGSIDYPYGEKPVGRITYDKTGRMSAQLMRPGRRSTVAPGTSLIAGNASGEEIREAVSGFIAYFGTFDVDESATTVIHHVQACLVPSWVGTDLKRTYRFNDHRLVLTAVNMTSVLELIWERERD
jgi:lipocalin-like protein